MRRLAIFVEGYTEEIFVIKLLNALANKQKIAYEIRRQRYATLHVARLPSMLNPDWYILVVNCNTDNQVKTQIINNYESLNKKGYDKIIGIRDVYPKMHSDVPRLETLLNFNLPIGTTPIKIHLAVLEVESWFIEEISHFLRIDPTLTINVIKQFGFDYENAFASDIVNPATTLDDIYKLAGKNYNKSTSDVHRTIEALDFDQMFNAVRKKSVSFDQVMTSIESTLIQ